MASVSSRPLSALLGIAVLPAVLAAQAAVDPSVAPRAALMAREGDRAQATEMLGRYLATAPDDGSAWLQLGLFYLADSRDWHRRGHVGQPGGPLFLDLAALALDESLRAPTDSGRLVRATVELARSASGVEDQGWDATLAASPAAPGVEPPAYVVEFGRNLVNSCPVGGVMVTPTDLEAVGVWSIVLNQRVRGDLVLFLPGLYGEDSLYRSRMAQVLQIDALMPVRAALERAAAHRPVCFSPTADSTLTDNAPLTVIRLVRVAGPSHAEVPDPLSIADLAAVWNSRPTGLPRDVAALYLQAARFNQVLCASLLLPLGVRQRDACGR
jgi:hypothetical protein